MALAPRLQYWLILEVFAWHIGQMKRLRVTLPSWSWLSLLSSAAFAVCIIFDCVEFAYETASVYALINNSIAFTLCVHWTFGRIPNRECQEPLVS